MKNGMLVLRKYKTEEEVCIEHDRSIREHFGPFHAPTVQLAKSKLRVIVTSMGFRIPNDVVYK